jgi:hypothetical protein
MHRLLQVDFVVALLDRAGVVGHGRGFDMKPGAWKVDVCAPLT